MKQMLAMATAVHKEIITMGDDRPGKEYDEMEDTVERRR